MTRSDRRTLGTGPRPVDTPLDATGRRLLPVETCHPDTGPQTAEQATQTPATTARRPLAQRDPEQ